jgi:hypothetical protein
MARRNPSKAVYIGTGIVAAAAVLYLLVRSNAASASTSSGGKSVEEDVTEAGAGAAGARRKIAQDTLTARMQSPTVYEADGSARTVTAREGAQLVNSGSYQWNATRTAVIHKSRV